MKRKIIEPVAPSGMELRLTYFCPTCQAPASVIAPLHAGKIRCPLCQLEYPIIPADALTLQYLRLMFADGKAIIHPDYM